MSVIKPKVSRFQILLINFTYKLQLQLGNLIYVQNCIIFGLDEFLYINFQILSRNREKSKLRFFWDSLLTILEGSQSSTLTFTLCLIFMILVSLENVKKYSHVVAQLPQRLKSTLFEIFSTLRVPFGHPPFEKISNNVDFSL